MDQCPFCGALKDPYQPSPAFIKYDCGTEMYRHLVDYVRKDTCYTSEIIELQTQLAHQNTLLREALEVVDELIFGANYMTTAIDRMTDRLDCPGYLHHSMQVYESKGKAAQALIPKIREAIK